MMRRVGGVSVVTGVFCRRRTVRVAAVDILADVRTLRQAGSNWQAKGTERQPVGTGAALLQSRPALDPAAVDHLLHRRDGLARLCAPGHHVGGKYRYGF
jgi:hypothetical protein